MINLLDFYFGNIRKEEYHYRFYDIIKYLVNESLLYDLNNPDRKKFEVFDSIEALRKIVDLCEPNMNYTLKEEVLFYTSCYFIYKSGYRIKQFPDIVSRPPESLSEFSYDDIRNRLISMGIKTANGSVPYAKRRAFASEFVLEETPGRTFKDLTLDEKFIETSNRKALFSEMATDEKIAELNNMIEHLLKKGGKYLELDYSPIAFSFIDDQKIKEYKKTTQCFRHKSEESIAEKNKFTDLQKEFLIEFGIILITTIHEIVGALPKE